jgi:hypothetical protein
MKRAPWVALASLALLVAASAWKHEKPAPPPIVHTPVDFTGIDTIDLERFGVANVVLVAPGSPNDVRQSLGYPLVVRRHDGKLELEIDYDDHADIVLRAPNTLHRIAGVFGKVTAQAPVSSLEIEAGMGVDWSGDADRLRIDCESFCKADVEIQAGRIRELSVRIDEGKLVLAHPSDIGTVRLELGPEASYTLGKLQGPSPAITVVRFDPAD